VYPASEFIKDTVTLHVELERVSRARVAIKLRYELSCDAALLPSRCGSPGP
jgi:hypothetical protein